MKCPYCNLEFSDSVLPLHLNRCKEINKQVTEKELEPDLSKEKESEEINSSNEIINETINEIMVNKSSTTSTKNNKNKKL